MPLSNDASTSSRQLYMFSPAAGTANEVTMTLLGQAKQRASNKPVIDAIPHLLSESSERQRPYNRSNPHFSLNSAAATGTATSDIRVMEHGDISLPPISSLHVEGMHPVHTQEAITSEPEPAQISAQVDELAIESRAASRSVRNEIERNRGEVAQTRSEIHELSERVKDESQLEKQRSNIERLLIAPGATYDESLICMKDTRSQIIGEALSFLTRGEVGVTRVFLLYSCAGAGKTAIAHSVAHICDEEHHCLGASFIFQAGETLRNNPGRLVSTVARELSAQNSDYASRLGDVIEASPSITYAPITNQFQSLLLRPLSKISPPSRPVAIVIDAIDEGWSEQVLHVIKSFSKLPSWIRVFITLRDDGIILPRLRSQTHIYRREINIGDDSNSRDIRHYISERLRAIAEEREVEDWPTEDVINRMCFKAGGLFVWAAVACSSISNPELNPVSQFEELVSDGPIRDTVASGQMDELYVKVLSKCNLNESRALVRFHQCLGTIITLKRPLSASAIDAINGTDHTRHTLRKLNPVLFGIGSPTSSQPIHIIHQSFREFITQQSNDVSAKYVIVESEHNELLALQCLRIVNTEMPLLVEQTRWIVDERRNWESSVPTLREDVISEALWYACEYVLEHVKAVKRMVPGISNALAHFIRENLYGWLAVCAMKGRCQGIETLVDDEQLLNLFQICHFEPSLLARVVGNLSSRLAYDGRLEDALLTARASVSLYRTAGMDTNEEMDSMATALYNLSCRLWFVNQPEEALAASHDSVDIRRVLARDQPTTFKPGLVLSLNALSLSLSSLGRHEDALAVSEESVNNCRDLVRDRPATFNSYLASSLSIISNHRSSLGRYEESLTASRESVILYRNLARDQPATFDARKLVSSLCNFSQALSNLNQHEEALVVLQESVTHHRDLTRDRSGTFNPSLASSLKQLSNRFYNLGRYDDAAAVARESIHLYRDLIRERPTHFKANLAYALNALSVSLARLQQRDRALEAACESVCLLRPLAKARPAVFDSALAKHLLNLARCLADDKHRLSEAVSTCREAEILYRALAEQKPLVYRSRWKDARDFLILLEKQTLTP